MGIMKYESHYELEHEALLQIATCKEILTSHGTEYGDIYQLQNDPYIQEQWKAVFPKCHDTACDRQCNDPAYTYYRTADGSCNNQNHRQWGKARTPHQRMLPPDYGDYYNLGYLPRKGKHYPLPSARKVSNIVLSGSMKYAFDSVLSLEMMSWGQFLDHDIALTPESKGFDGENIECCGSDHTYERAECFPIKINHEEYDPYFNGDRATTCMNFVRSAPAVPTDGTCKPHWREQLNEQTSYIDGSMIYGTSYEEQHSLREHVYGKMETVHGKYLPEADNSTCELRTTPPTGHCTRTGDPRSNEIPHLNLHHTLFVREHNALAHRLHYCHQSWDDEKVFQETRKIIIAIIQKITYNDFLPKLLGYQIMERYKLRVGHGDDNYYNPDTNPSVFNGFATAAYRVGHSMIPDKISFSTNDYPTHIQIDDYKDFDLSKTFFDPFFTTHDDPTLLHEEARALLNDKAGFVDGKFSEEVRNLLFIDDLNQSFDLMALNIQRGRDHGLPGYNAWRKYCGLKVAINFLDLSDHSWKDQLLLYTAYGHVDDIDLFAGGITEKLLPGARVGPTFACILGLQFGALKHGDRFWFEREQPYEYSSHFTKDQINAIYDVTLAKIMCKNYQLDYIQEDVFRQPSHELLTRCHSLPDLDLTPWGCY
ncbi:peroxidasin homolog pxn-2-like [Argopecten irradians]|uniref:peroxidasin homolog pxn-2-like n=1 Tax=Argopecten irradians TaxID=31199 RepID=UPI00371DBC7F